ncbi:hypothetical protein LROSL1_0036 [Furfurilactobacillus rossiae]|uniref:HEPN domain-containing protein n=1 Tax=Furfurilactobacillus rossiae TaxID=231049 RepID=UPI0015BAFD68|nr:HEPN domain-containing protein [Furfurilactobacillus rossiae]MCF6165129.1 hypothetical protein [Furfurilactobacillus rossiae]QLE62856.1 hypothetical protein LROSL1_0036 [Furfurilactobacillus rossiae]
MTKLINENMFGHFEFQGIWSVKKEINPENWIPGKLHYDSGNILLEVFGTLNVSETSAIDVLNFEDYESVFGFAQTGENIVLSTVSMIGNTNSIPGLISERYRVSDMLITNGNFNKVTQRQYLSFFRFSLTDLNVWLPNNMLTIKKEPKSGKQIFEVKKPERKILTNFDFDGGNFSVSLDESGTINYPRELLKVNIKNETGLIIEPNSNSVSMLQSTKIVNETAKFFTVLLGETISAKYLQGNLSNGLKANVLFNQTYPIRSVERESDLRITPRYNDVEDELPNSLTNWFDMSSELKLLADDYILTVTQESIIENTLINLTEGVESFFRNRDACLRDKLTFLFKRVPNEILNRDVLQKSIDSEDDFIKSLVNTRVYLTHGKVRPGIYKDEKLIIATRILQLSVRYFLLSEIGFSKKSLQSVGADIAEIFHTRFFNNELHF